MVKSMTVQYWIGDFFVDLSRNQITRKEQYQTIAPKALAVLTFLAQNQGKVVSYDELLSEVWPNTIVTPNTLQRSIAQLRKALGEDSKIQSYIKTHAKQGYSLECDVQWDVPNEIQSISAHKLEIQKELNSKYDPHTSQEQPYEHESVTETKKKLDIETNPSGAHSSTQNNASTVSVVSQVKVKHSNIKRIFSIAGIIILILMAVDYFSPKKTIQLSFDKLQSLTATDDKEFDAIYSPDGKYIIFNRYIGKLCINNIWAKNLETQQEIKLTKNLGSYSGHTLSNDGKTLAFIETEDCRKPLDQNKFYHLKSLDFVKSLSTPQAPNLILQCKISQIQKSVWLNNNDIALLQKHSKRWKLIRYSISDNSSTDIYELKQGNLIHFSYSSSDNIFAIITIHKDNKQYIDILTPDGTLISSNKIEYPPEISEFRLIYPDFDQIYKNLVFGTGKQLFTLSYGGKINKVDFPLNENMGSIKLHPDGKKLLLIKGPYDSDIASLPRIRPKQKESLLQTNTGQEYSTIERSIVGEEHGIFQPNGNLIAFTSERSGEYQVWITDGISPHQISNFPIDTYIRGIDWAEDGQSLLVNGNSELYQVFLDSTQKSFSLSEPITRLFQWNSKNNTALLTARIQGVSKFLEYNLASSEFNVLNEKKISWALRSEDGRLIYNDHMNRFWQSGPTEDQLIEALSNQNALGRFVMKGNVIFSINSDNQLWSYNLDTNLFEIIRDMPENIDYLTDISETQFLLELRVAAKKEVVELSSNE